MMGPYGGDGPFHWLIGLIAFLVFAIPTVKILRKAGYSGLWVLVTLVPVLNVIMYWVFAFSRWPLEDRAGA